MKYIGNVSGVAPVKLVICTSPWVRLMAFPNSGRGYELLDLDLEPVDECVKNLLEYK